MRVSDPQRDYYVSLAQCKGCGHCGDLGMPSPYDPQSLQLQRQTIANYARLWMGLPPAPGAGAAFRGSLSLSSNNAEL